MAIDMHMEKCAIITNKQVCRADSVCYCIQCDSPICRLHRYKIGGGLFVCPECHSIRKSLTSVESFTSISDLPEDTSEW